MTMINGPEPIRSNLGASILGPRNLPLERENADQLARKVREALAAAI